LPVNQIKTKEKDKTMEINRNPVNMFIKNMNKALGIEINIKNAYLDAEIYGWNIDTVNAIKVRIYEAFGLLVAEVIHG
jgi:hypothetical protein